MMRVLLSRIPFDPFVWWQGDPKLFQGCIAPQLPSWRGFAAVRVGKTTKFVSRAR